MLFNFYFLFYMVRWLGRGYCTDLLHGAWIQYFHWNSELVVVPNQSGLLYILRSSGKSLLSARWYVDPRKWAFSYWKSTVPSTTFLNDYGRRDHCLWSTYSSRRVAEFWHSSRPGDGEMTKDSGDHLKVCFPT